MYEALRGDYNDFFKFFYNIKMNPEEAITYRPLSDIQEFTNYKKLD
jgi:hypothetical protein